jgi:hypothetical protein
MAGVFILIVQGMGMYGEDKQGRAVHTN